MTRPATLVFLLLGLALLARRDGDGLLARAGVGARALGVEVRIEFRLQRARPRPPALCLPDAAHTALSGGRAPCE